MDTPGHMRAGDTPFDRALMDHAPESIVVLDAAGHVLAWNRASESLYGWGRQEMLGESMVRHLCCRVVGPGTAGLVPADMLREWTGWMRRFARNGDEVHVKVVRRRLAEDDPTGGHIVEFATDVTALQDDRKVLEGLALRYQNLFNAMPAAFWELDFAEVVDRVGTLTGDHAVHLAVLLSRQPSLVRELIGATRIVQVNHTAVQVFELGDRHPDDLNAFWPDESLHVFAHSVIAALQGQRTFTAECAFLTLTGRRIEATFTVNMAPDALSRARLLIGIVDLTQSKQAHAALAESERRNRELLDSTPSAIVEIDCSAQYTMLRDLRDAGVTDIHAYLDANPAFVIEALRVSRVVSCNDYLLKLMRAQTTAQACVPLLDYWSPSPHIYRQFIEARFEGRHHWQAETRMVRFDGTHIDVLVSSAFGSITERPFSALVSLVDVGPRMQAEERLARAQDDLAHAARVAVLGELTASIAHEVSQPLSTILIDADSLKRWLAHSEPDLAEVRELASRTAEQAQRAAEVLDRIRAMARRSLPELRPVDLNALIHEAVTFVRYELQRRAVTLELRLAPGLPVVLGDAVQLQQVIVNLAINAVQAMVANGSPIRRLRLTTDASNDGSVRIWVEDTGPGVTGDSAARLFDSFFTTKEEGMGIGLPISRSIVELHAGTLALGPPLEGWGARFVVAIPAMAPVT